MSEKLELLHTDRVLIVEGKYDAARLSHLTDAMEELDYRLTSLTSEPLPGGALLLRLDFGQ